MEFYALPRDSRSVRPLMSGKGLRLDTGHTEASFFRVPHGRDRGFHRRFFRLGGDVVTVLLSRRLAR